MSYYERNLPHIERDFRPHFVTFATYKRTPLQPWARDIVMEACCHHDEKTCDLLAGVVMPDHVHFILVPRVDEAQPMCGAFVLDNTVDQRIFSPAN
jgi:REP element-mobilizing transposase RayT